MSVFWLIFALANIPFLLFVFYVVVSLRGTRTAAAAAFLSVAMIILCGGVIITSGWKVGLVAFLMLILGTRYLYIPGLMTARRLSGYRLPNVRLEPRPRGPISSVSEVLAGDPARDAALKRIQSDQSVIKILDYHGRTAADLSELHSWLGMNGAGEVAIEILSNPRDLDLFLWAKDQKGYSAMDVCIKMTQWPPPYLSGRPFV